MANFRDTRHISGTATIHPRLIRILNGFRKQDSPAARVLPIPVQVLQRAFAIAVLQNTMLSLGAADLIWLAFFFLPRPGEYTVTRTEPHPFTLADVRLWHNSTPLDPITAPADELLQATFVVLIFIDQKNAVRGETVGHGHSPCLPCPLNRAMNSPPLNLQRLAIHTTLCTECSWWLGSLAVASSPLFGDHSKEERMPIPPVSSCNERRARYTSRR
jgi:hypothetical protein